MELPEELSRLLDMGAEYGALALAAGGEWGARGAELGGAWAGQVLALELPIPDVAFVAACALGGVALYLSLHGRALEAQGEVEALYQAELLTANRRAQQAQGDLRRAHLEIERERQKRRREARGAGPRAARVVALSEAKVRIAAGG